MNIFIDRSHKNPTEMPVNIHIIFVFFCASRYVQVMHYTVFLGACHVFIRVDFQKYFVDNFDVTKHIYG